MTRGRLGGFTREEVTDCWKQKVDACGGEFVSISKTGKPKSVKEAGK